MGEISYELTICVRINSYYCNVTIWVSWCHAMVKSIWEAVHKFCLWGECLLQVFSRILLTPLAITALDAVAYLSMRPLTGLVLRAHTHLQVCLLPSWLRNLMQASTFVLFDNLFTHLCPVKSHWPFKVQRMHVSSKEGFSSSNIMEHGLLSELL